MKQRVDPTATSGEDCEFWMATVLMTGLRSAGIDETGFEESLP